eukprot:COSAG01_NODE_3393_length_6149_cov_24.742149_11_plen_49_part_00
MRLLLKALDADGDGRVSEEDFLYGEWGAVPGTPRARRPNGTPLCDVMI